MGVSGGLEGRLDSGSADKVLCPLGEVLRLDSGLAQANFGPIPGGRFPDTHAQAH